ncbi:DUF3800 domain-containing protein [Mycoplasma phocoeninasale]|uniref:DUF3800 domain-containing protein n=1 Tax=Mycoplasma phocoeninasale TaxID=2726117 RepID=A0A858U2W0_9MOLU|nr:DUF3800 domain-containing protein [Mycoplasma phocoeninasale]QJG66291.1 DUF3800 domain-containing protein [Mycoplasma phocoeninasale]
MDIFVYSDESGVFDQKHNHYFVFGGLIFLEKKNRDEYSRIYSGAERQIKAKHGYDKNKELKANILSQNEKGRLFKLLNNCYKFGVVIDQLAVNSKIFNDKKSKQRYLDFAYKIAIKKAFEELIKTKIISPNDVKNIHFFVDEHTTATNGKYELRESLEQEFKIGIINYEYNKYFEPIFEKLNSLDLSYVNSSSNLLIRAADIVANRIYSFCQKKLINKLKKNQKLFLFKLPHK